MEEKQLYAITFRFGYDGRKKNSLTQAFHKVRKGFKPQIAEIVSRAGGEIVQSGAGYGTKGNYLKHSMEVIVRVPEKAAYEIQALGDNVFVTHISKEGDLHRWRLKPST
jgi:hypothetical protein